VRRIVLIPSWYPSPESPVTGIFVREQARCLAQRFDVTVLTPRFPSLANQLRLRWGPEFEQENDSGVRTCRVRKLKIPTLRRWIPFLNGPDHVLVFYRKFAAAIRRGFHRHVREHGLPDLIHAHVVLPAGWIAIELGRAFGVPVVLTEHSGPFSMHLQTKKQQELVRDILTGMTRVVAVGTTLKKTMQAFCPRLDIDVIGNVIDTDFFTPGPPSFAEQPFSFLFVGALVEGKGVQHLLPAVRLLQGQARADFEIRIAGAGPYRRALEQMAANLGVLPRCRFLGALDRPAVREEMRRCDGFVLPSLAETFGVVLVEAMACGKPVLATRCGGPEELVTPETGVLVETADPPALAAAMADFVERRRNFDRGRIRDSVVRRFGQDSFLDRMGALYARLVPGF
jgi:glycosyltransferase involved in cell wall biosynthesis